MKKSLRVLVKAVFVAVLLTGSVFTLSTAGVETVSQAHAAVSAQTVNQYLVSRGYTVISMAETPEKANEDWVCHTIFQGIHYWSTVHVLGTEIIGQTDVIY